MDEWKDLYSQRIFRQTHRINKAQKPPKELDQILRQVTIEFRRKERQDYASKNPQSIANSCSKTQKTKFKKMWWKSTVEVVANGEETEIKRRVDILFRKVSESSFIKP